ncbi:MAG: phage Gp37/Gp68 family protein [Pseudomonadota bacterium]
MSENSKIEWTDHTFNPWEGCQKVGPGCDNCYAEARNARYGAGVAVNWGPGAPRRRTSNANWQKPIAWDKAHAEFYAQHGRRQRVFCASLADVFDNAVDPAWRSDLFDLIELTPNLDWLLLTKRIGNVADMVRRAKSHDWLAGRNNVWLGATVVNQGEADRDVPKLLDVQALVRFLSIEPILGPICLTELQPPGESRTWIDALRGTASSLAGTGPTWAVPRIDWVIVGGESGPGARPMHPTWAQQLRNECAAAGVPFLFKQWGEWLPISQQEEDFTNRLYRSQRKAKLHEDQGAIDELYGRRCTVESAVVQLDGSTHRITAPGAFLQGTDPMTTFKVGKKAAARLLDTATHDGAPT